VFIWIFVLVHLTIMSNLSTDIIGGTCVPWAAYVSYAAQRCVIPVNITITYLLPLVVMLFCYTRIVYKLTFKVTLTLIILLTANTQVLIYDTTYDISLRILTARSIEMTDSVLRLPTQMPPGTCGPRVTDDRQ